MQIYSDLQSISAETSSQDGYKLKFNSKKISTNSFTTLFICMHWKSKPKFFKYNKKKEKLKPQQLKERWSKSSLPSLNNGSKCLRVDYCHTCTNIGSDVNDILG